MDDTIYAVSSGRPPAAIAVLRVSGADAFAVTETLAGRLPPPRQARLRSLRDPATGMLLDQAIVLVFAGPATATGEDLVELHLHGGGAVVRAVAAALGRDRRTRAAEAGEFTRRALLNGRIDLTQAEGLADLLAAETEIQRRAAIGASGGMLRRNITGIAAALLAICARAEASLDFSDEADVEADDLGAIHAAIDLLAATIDTLLCRPTIDRLRDGFRVVLAGPPNSGKSSLVNAMVEREVSIVSAIAGTTRDRIEAHVSVGDLPIVVIDTAGIVERTTDAIEAIGIARAHAAIDDADVILWLGDGPVPAAYRDRAIALHPRTDVAGRGAVPQGRIGLSSVTRDGIDRLWAAIVARLSDRVPPGDAVAFNDRQHALLSGANDALRSARREDELLLVAERLRQARQAIDRITGQADVEAMLDQLFGRFCIGK